MTVKELAERQGVSVQAISKLTTELVDLGYLEATVDPDDGRRRLLDLSERGRAAVEASRTSRRRLQRRIERRLGKEEARATADALAEVLELLGGTDAVRRRRVRQPGT